MTRLRLAAYNELSKVAKLAGFDWVRCEGSHNTFRNNAGRIVVIPGHMLVKYAEELHAYSEHLQSLQFSCL